MDVKEYLSQIENDDARLDITRAEIKRLKDIPINISISASEKVQSSLKGDKLADNVVEYTKLESELTGEEIKYLKERNKRINLIFKLSSPLHMKILYKKYAEYKPLATIAKELGYSEQHMKEEHGKAIGKLMEIYKLEKKKENTLPKTYQKPTDTLPLSY